MADYGYGNRRDGTPKGLGFFGPIKRPDGRDSTEVSVGLDIYGKPIDVPSMVPTLTREELDYILNNDEKTLFKQRTPLVNSILNKAEAHARQRIDAGKSPFALDGEIYNLPTAPTPLQNMVK